MRIPTKILQIAFIAGKAITKSVNYLRFYFLTLSYQYPSNSIKSDSQLLAWLLLIAQILLGFISYEN